MTEPMPPERLATLRVVHREWKLYKPCGHDHHENEDGLVEIDEIGWVCADGYTRSVCWGCCAINHDVVEHCENAHDIPCWPCETAEALAEVERLTGDLGKARDAHDTRLREVEALQVTMNARVAEHTGSLDRMQSSAIGFQAERDHAIRLLRQAIDLRQNGQGDTAERNAWRNWDLNTSAWLGRDQPGAPLCQCCKEDPPHRPGHPDLVGVFCEGCINTCHQTDATDHACPVCRWPGEQRAQPAEGAPDAG